MIGDTIKRLRTAKKLFQQDLADRLGVSKSTVAMWETNKREPNIDSINKIAEILECSPSYLIGDTSDSTKGFRTDYSGWQAAECYCEKMFRDKAEQDVANGILHTLICLNLKGLQKIEERVLELQYIPDCNNTGITREDDFLANKTDE